MFGIVAMLGSVVLLIQTLQQTLAQMTTNNPRMGAQQALQVVVCTHAHTQTQECMNHCEFHFAEPDQRSLGLWVYTSVYINAVIELSNCCS